eukprot:254216-Chlamydomonas_euryale.AAC.1
MWLASRPCTKLGGNAVVCARLSTRPRSMPRDAAAPPAPPLPTPPPQTPPPSGSSTVADCSDVRTAARGTAARYGCTTGRPMGLVHATGTPVDETACALARSHSLTSLTLVKTSEMQSNVRRAR